MSAVRSGDEQAWEKARGDVEERVQKVLISMTPETRGVFEATTGNNDVTTGRRRSQGTKKMPSYSRSSQ